jgi:Putative zinc-finger
VSTGNNTLIEVLFPFYSHLRKKIYLAGNNPRSPLLFFLNQDKILTTLAGCWLTQQISTMLPCPTGTVMSEIRPKQLRAQLADEPGRSDKVKEGNAKLTSRCEAIRSQMFFYLDHELHDRELSDFEQHLESCIECRSLCDQERCIIESVRAARPMHVASPELRDRIADLLE